MVGNNLEHSIKKNLVNSIHSGNNSVLLCNISPVITIILVLFLIVLMYLNKLSKTILYSLCFACKCI